MRHLCKRNLLISEQTGHFFETGNKNKFKYKFSDGNHEVTLVSIYETTYVRIDSDCIYTNLTVKIPYG